MPVPELEALIYLYEAFQRHQQPTCAQASQHLLGLAGLPDDAPRCKVPDSIGVGSAHQLLTPFTTAIDGVAGNQPEGVMAALTGEDWGEARERGVAVDALLLLLAFIATDTRPARVRLAFWALDREGKGYLTREQVMRAVDPLIAVARVGALLQALEAGRPSAVHQAPLGAPATRKLMYHILGRSLDPADPSRPTTLTQPAFDELLDHTAGQLSTIIFQQATSATPPPPASTTPTIPPVHSPAMGGDPRRTTDPFHRPMPPRPDSPRTPLHPPPAMAGPDYGARSPGAETASTYRTTLEMLHSQDPSQFPSRHRRLSGGSRPSSSTIAFGHDHIPEEAPDLRLDLRPPRPPQVLHLDTTGGPPPQHLQGPPPMTPFYPPGLPRINPTVQFEAPEVQTMRSGTSLTAAAERAESEGLQQQEIRRHRTRRLSQRLNGHGRVQNNAGVYASLQNTILDTSLQVFAVCSGSLLMLLAVLFMNAALIVYLFRTQRLRLEVSLAVTVGFNLGLVAIIAISIVIRAKCNACKAAAAAAQRRSSDGHPEDIQLDGIIPPFLQPFVKRFLLTFNNESQPHTARAAAPSSADGAVRGDQPPPADGLSSKLRALWATVGRMAGFDNHPSSLPPASPYPPLEVRTPQSESPEFRNTGRHMSSVAVPPMRSYNALVPSNVVREAYRDF